MKTFTFGLLAFFTIALCSCNDTEERNPEAALLGNWEMTRAYGGMTGTVHNIPAGTVTWSFDTANNTVTVVNNNVDPDLMTGLDSGTYRYKIVNSDAPESCARTLQIDDNDYGCYTRTNAGLTISQVYADGLIYDFESRN